MLCDSIAVGANYQNYFIGVQSVVIDPKDRLWVLDSGLSTTPNGTSVSSSYGGPKLIGIDLINNSIFTTIVFSTSVVYPDSVSPPLPLLSPVSYA